MRPDLLALASSLAAREERFALVTVVRREPPSSARVGDTAVVTEKGDYYGWVGGGCTRSTVLREALRAIAGGEPRLLSLSPDPAGARRPGVVALPMTCDSGGTVEIYIEPVPPVARLLLFGSSPVVRVLARIGRAVGYRIEVIDPDADQADFPEAERVLKEIAPDAVPRGAHVLVATMGERDLKTIEAVVTRAPAYLGVIASRTRFAQLRDALIARGVSRDALEGIAAPAGLDIGARTPEEIALSIMAQIVERRRRAAAETPQTGDSAPAGVAPREKTREAIDPVCGMAVTIAGARHHAGVRGLTYYFCCAGCRTKFLADPARYLAAGAEARGS
ncbi:MAG: XdhC family protein [Elusimicrobia bacterium]|nr:XdhC family protein [Elusimicrobiota bacterium]